MILIIQFGGDLSNAKARALAIGNLAVCCELHLQIVKILCPEMHRPPDARMTEIEFGKLLRGEGNRPGLVWPKFDSLGEANAFDSSTQRTFDFMIGCVVDLGVNGQVRGLK